VIRIEIGRRSVVALAALVVLAVVGVAYSAIPNSNGEITACYNEQSGQLRVTDTDTGTPRACGNNEVALAWSQTGAGISGREIVGGDSPTNSTDLKFAVAQCPTGKVPTGGGGGILGPAGDINSVEQVALIDSHPIAAPFTGWQVAAKEMVATDNNWRVRASAVCVSVP
jgi:hypothetical protein